MSRPSPDEYLIEFAEHYNIPEMGRYCKNLRSKIQQKFVFTRFGIAQTPKKQELEDLINSEFGDFCRFVSEYFEKPVFNPCRKRKLSDYASKRALAKSITSVDARRKEIRRYFCKKCNSWHLTSKKNRKTL